MSRSRNVVFIILASASLLVAALSGPQPLAEDEGGKDGKAIFLAQKCETCHAVPGESIEAKTKSEAMKGPDIAGLSRDGDELGQYLRKKAQIDGKDHKKEFKGSDEDLQLLVDWVLAQ